jgi:uncharacterized protein
MSYSEHIDTSVRPSKSVDLHSPVLITGFVGAGIIGSIAASRIIEHLGMKEIAAVRSRYIPPATVFDEGRLRHPFRIHATDDGKVCVALCEVPLRSDGLYDIASGLLDWAEQNGVREVVVMDGVPVPGAPSEYKTFCAAEGEKCSALKNKGLRIIEQGLITGIAGSILNECLVRKVTGIAVLTTANANIPDPEGAANLIESLNRIYDLKVDVQKLKEEAEKIKERLKDIVDKYRQMKSLEQKREIPEHLYT